MKKENRLFSFRLRGRLLLSFMLVIALSVGLVVGYAALTPFSDIGDSGAFFSQQYAVRFSPLFSASYASDPSWGEANHLLEQLVQNPAQDAVLPGTLGPSEIVELQEAFRIDRIILLNAAGEVVGDSRSDALGSDLTPDLTPKEDALAQLQPSAVPIVDAAGETVGELIIVSGFNADFANRLQVGFRRIVTSVGVWTAVMAVIVSLVLSQRLARPLQQLSAAAIDLAEDRDLQIVSVTRNDEIGEMTEAFNRMASHIQEQRRLRKQMVADIAHELRTPLSIMRLDLAGMIDQLQTPELTAESLEQEIDALERLIVDLNLLSLADGQELKLELIELDPFNFVEQAVRHWGQLAKEQEVALILDPITAELPLIWVDERRLFQVMQNLVSNALRYAPPKSAIKFDVKVYQIDTLGAAIVFTVSDSGPGIRPEEIEFLFDRFYRASGGRVSERSGSGLGLAIAKQLVEMHKGQIWCESEYGDGCTFFVALPIG